VREGSISPTLGEGPVLLQTLEFKVQHYLFAR
jgi:hypothetical protein